MNDNPNPEYLNSAGQLIEQGRLVEASSLLCRCLEREPENAQAWCLMARVARLAGKLDIAANLMTAAIVRRPHDIEILAELAGILAELGNAGKAADCHRKILEIDPDNFTAHAALGRFHAAAGQLQDAYRHLRAAARLRPNEAAIYNQLGQVLLDAGVLNDAQTAFQACLEIEPNHVQALIRLGNLLRERGQTSLAIQQYEGALAVKANDPHILSNLGNAWLDLGEADRAVKCYKESLRHHPNAPTTHGNLVFALNYQSSLDAERVAAAHRQWARRHASKIKPMPPRIQDRRSGRRSLRLGLVSADFRQHPVGALATLLCGCLNPSQFTFYAYDNGARTDSITETLQRLVPNWRKIGGMNDDQAARLVRDDGIDILFDLSGHTAGGRLFLFARRPAPVQIALFAYPNTTGLRTMDYRITDALADPPGRTEHLYTEKLLRLSRTAWIYSPPPGAPEPRAAPVEAGAPFTFGCLNNPAKISVAAIQLWSRILRERPESRLMLLVRDEPEHAQILRQKFTNAGANPDQLWFRPRASLSTYLEYHHSVDLMLDPFPYNGGVTTCDALWMGVPVLTLAGDAYVSRQGVSVLSNVGLQQFIATTPDEFLHKAVDWARLPEGLTTLRAGLREKMRRSALLDHSAYGEELGQTLRHLHDPTLGAGKSVAPQ